MLTRWIPASRQIRCQCANQRGANRDRPPRLFSPDVAPVDRRLAQRRCPLRTLVPATQSASYLGCAHAYSSPHRPWHLLRSHLPGHVKGRRLSVVPLCAGKIHVVPHHRPRAGCDVAQELGCHWSGRWYSDKFMVRTKRVCAVAVLSVRLLRVYVAAGTSSSRE